MNLDSFFRPKSIAVIGASTDPKSVGHALLANLLEGYEGHVYPVNPKTTELLGKPCFPAVSDIPDTVDCALIAVPAKIVPTVLTQCADKGVRNVTIISAGFKETGGEGASLETEITRIARDRDITLLGPNCLGFLVPKLKLNASFAAGLPREGSILFASQSGALLTALLDHEREMLGFSRIVSMGNKSMIHESDILRFARDDEDTRVVGLYCEDIENAEELITLGQTLSSHGKSVVLLKSGRTEAGTHASTSHTGALAGSDAATTALATQGRMHRAETIEEFSLLLNVFSNNPLPRGKRVAILTNAGGLGVLATDACVKEGLSLATLSEHTVTSLQEFLPPAANTKNPIDLLGDAPAERYQKALDLLLADEGVDMVMVIVTPQLMTEDRATGEVIRDARSKSEKPLLTVLSGGARLNEGSHLLHEAHATVVGYPELAAFGLAALSRGAQWKDQPIVETTTCEPMPEQASSLLSSLGERTVLTESECWDFLSSYGFRFPEKRFAATPEEALREGKAIGKPLALKIVSPDITHKSDAGGVLLGIEPEKADQAFHRLFDSVRSHKPEAQLEGALLVEMSDPTGIELILGIKHEPSLGKLLMIGFGGIYAETFKDVSFRFSSPLSESDIHSMIEELLSYPILAGARGKVSIDKNALTHAVMTLARIADNVPTLSELDINPLLVFPEGDRFRVLDARMTLADPKRTETSSHIETLTPLKQPGIIARFFAKLLR